MFSGKKQKIHSSHHAHYAFCLFPLKRSAPRVIRPSSEAIIYPLCALFVMPFSPCALRSALCVSGFADTQFPSESNAGIELLLRSDNFHDIYQKLHKLNELANVLD
jgi:hypothetical protein